MKNFILFGPPGIGKSTIIGILKTLGIGAFDLEDFYPNRIRYQLPNLVQDKVIGAADLSPQRKYSNAYKILLIADQQSYDDRRRARDAVWKAKSNQTHHDVSTWLNADYDLILDTSKSSAQTTARLILHFINGRRSGNEK